MARRKLIRLKTQQDIEVACRQMDLEEHDLLDEFGDEIAESEYDERAHVLDACSGRFDDE